MKRIGLLAGVGRLPVEFARAAKGMGITVIAIQLLPEVDKELQAVAAKSYEISVGQLDKIITTLKAENVTKVTMLGKVTKELMFSGKVQMDLRLQKLLAGLTDHSDDAIMLAFVKELMQEEIGILDQTALIQSLMPPVGVLTNRSLTPQEKIDAEYGFSIAKHMGGLDIGQTVVVKAHAVMAVEAIEGTDACIKRGGLLGRGGVLVAKVAKPEQDMRFDVPSVGLSTIEAMIEAGAAALVMEANKTLLIDKDKVIQLADAHNIAIEVM
ncbi:MAG: UDP-2,3-diacylglucosamine diphosphatase LpxI [Pelosinus sp.]|nr:UDP-2,3-diacylglucosamine diphosphatase LpxI [Pelosinus sp.]